MIKMAEHLKGYWPNQLSSQNLRMVMRMLMTLQALHRTYTGADARSLQVWDNL
ncbi:IS4 orf [Shigella sonnei]|nr:IS4 orf [Shigella sonnei]